MDHQIAISVADVSKAYRIWDRPSSRVLAPTMEILADLLPTRSSTANSLRARARRHFHDFFALKNISFQIAKGESVGIIGRNGSGKSTLLQILAGTLRPTSGSVHISGRVGALLELGSGFNPEFTGRENVYLNGAVLGLHREQVDRSFSEIESFADIGDFIDQPVKTYSSGMIVRLAFSVQTSITPEIMIVDEALAVGDEAFQRKCFSRLRTMQDSGVTLLFVSHSAGQVVQLCDRAVLLEQGELTYAGHPKDVVNRYHRRLYGGNEPCETEPARIDTVANATTWTVTTSNIEPNCDSAFFGEMPTNSAIFEYPTAGATLSPPEIKTKSGARVNYLRRGNAYIYTYTARAIKDLYGVRFGAAIRTATGIELAGMASHADTERLPFVEAGTVFQLRFHFICRLIPGLYFMNAGFLAQDATGQEYFAHRLVDALMFRVIAEGNISVNGIVDLMEKVELSTSSPSANES